MCVLYIIITHYPGFTIANMYFSMFFITTYLYFVHTLHHIPELLFQWTGYMMGIHHCVVAGVVKAVVCAVLSGQARLKDPMLQDSSETASQRLQRIHPVSSD